MSELEERRRDFEIRLEQAHASLEEAVGWAPRAKAWVLPLLAMGAGLAAALFLRRSGRRR